MATQAGCETMSLHLHNIVLRCRSCAFCAKILNTSGFAVVESDVGELAASVENGCAGYSLLLQGIIKC